MSTKRKRAVLSIKDKQIIISQNGKQVFADNQLQSNLEYPDFDYPHRLKKTSSMQSKRRDLYHTWLHRETNEKTYLL